MYGTEAVMDLTGSKDRRIEVIYQETKGDLLAFFLRRHGSAETAEDLLHTTFAAALKRPERLLQAESARAYLFGIARNLSADWHRRKLPAEELKAEPASVAAAEADERLEAMREAIHALNPAWRQVLELRLRDEMSYEEIAARIGLPIGTVRSRLHHAVRQLRNDLRQRKSDL